MESVSPIHIDDAGKFPTLAPVEIQTTSPVAIMTRAAPGDGAKRNGPPAANQSRAASVTPGSYDATSRTFDIVLTSFADVRRYGMTEQLSSDPADWDLSRIAPGQVKFLDSHSQGSINAVSAP